MSAFRYMEWEQKGNLNVDAIQIFLCTQNLEPDKFIEQDFQELIRIYDRDEDGRVTFSDFNESLIPKREYRVKTE